MIQVVAALRCGACLRRSITGGRPRSPGQCQTTRVDDSYADLARVRSSSLYIWTIPDDFPAPCRAEIVLLFEDASSAITHRRYVIDFTPFTPTDLTAAIHSARLTLIGDSYQPGNPFYAVAPTTR